MSELSVDVKLNQRQAVESAKKLGDAFEDTADDLEKLSDSRAGQDIDKDLKRAEDAAEDLSSELDSTRRDLDRVGDAARNAGNDGDAGLGKIKRGAQEVQQEVGQNLGEAVSSLRGDFSDLGQVGQDTLGGLAATVAGAGPAGLVGALGLAAGAAGLGALTAGFEEAEEKRRELADRASDLAKAYIDAGSKVLDSFAAVERAQDVISDPEKMKQVEAYKDAIGVDLNVALGAYVGRAEDVAKVQAIVNDTIEKNSDIVGENAGALETARGAQSQTYQENQKLIESGNELIGVTQGAAAQFDTMSAYLNHVADTTANATRTTDEFGDTIVSLPDGKQIYIDAETGQATEDTDAIEKKIYGISDKTVTLTAENSSLLRAIRDWENWTPSAKFATVYATPAPGAGIMRWE